MKRKIILGICFGCAVSAVAVLGYWYANADPGAKEFDYLDKADAASRRAQAAMDVSHDSPSGSPLADVKVSDYQPALDEDKTYRALAEAEMGRRTARNKNLICLGTALAMVSLASGMFLLLPSSRA